MSSCLLEQCHSLLVVDTHALVAILIGHRNEADFLAKQALQVNFDLQFTPNPWRHGDIASFLVVVRHALYAVMHTFHGCAW